MDERGRGAHRRADEAGAELQRWAADARVEEAARQRARERWLRQQADEGATLAGVLADLAERGTPVAVRTRAGRRHRGRIRAMGADFVALAPLPDAGPGEAADAARQPGDDPGVPGDPAGSQVAGPEVVIALAAVSSVRTPPGVPAAAGDRPVRSTARLAELLGDLAAERERALVVPLDGEGAVTGTIRSVGEDVVVVRPDGPRASVAYVPLAAIAEVVLGG